MKVTLKSTPKDFSMDQKANFYLKIYQTKNKIHNKELEFKAFKQLIQRYKVSIFTLYPKGNSLPEHSNRLLSLNFNFQRFKTNLFISSMDIASSIKLEKRIKDVYKNQEIVDIKKMFTMNSMKLNISSNIFGTKEMNLSQFPQSNKELDLKPQTKCRIPNLNTLRRNILLNLLPDPKTKLSKKDYFIKFGILLRIGERNEETEEFLLKQNTKMDMPEPIQAMHQIENS